MTALQSFANVPRFGGTGNLPAFNDPTQQNRLAINNPAGTFNQNAGFRNPSNPVGTGVPPGAQRFQGGQGFQQGGQGVGIGLGGAEQAQGQTLQNLFNVLQGGNNQSNQALIQALMGANQQLGAGEQNAMGQLNQFFGAGNQAFNRGVGSFERGNQAFNLGAQNFERGGQQIGQGIAGLDPFTQRGGNAQSLALALAGGEGSEEAFRNFQDSPGQKFLQEQGERSVIRNAAATGGLGGGNVQRELVEFGQGLSAQQLNNRIAQLSGLGAQGLQSAQSQGQLFGQQGALSGQQGQFRGQQGQLLGQLGQFQGQQGQFLGERGLAGAEVAGQGALARAGNIFNTGTLQSQGALGTSSQLANALTGIGSQQAANRLLTGQQLAGQRSDQAGALANLAQGQGAGLSGLTGNQGNLLMQLLSGAGSADANALQNFAQLLSNASTGAAGSVGGLGGIPGVQQGDSSTQNSLIGGGATLLAALLMSDVRLKENIQPIGSLNGHNMYTWDWNEEGRRIAGNQPTVGVMAQELEEICPEAIVKGEDGYLRVDYRKL